MTARVVRSVSWGGAGQCERGRAVGAVIGWAGVPGVRVVARGGVVAGIGWSGRQRQAVSRNRTRGSVPHATRGPRAVPGSPITSMPSGWRT